VEIGLFVLEVIQTSKYGLGDWVITDTDHNFLALVSSHSFEFEDIASNIDTVFLMWGIESRFQSTLIKRYLELEPMTKPMRLSS